MGETKVAEREPETDVKVELPDRRVRRRAERHQKTKQQAEGFVRRVPIAPVTT